MKRGEKYSWWIKRIKNETLPCYEPSIGNEEIAVLKKVINSGWLSENKYTRIFEKKIAKYSQRKFSLAFNNATAAMITGMKAFILNYFYYSKEESDIQLETLNL